MTKHNDGKVSEFPVITLYQPWATWIMRGWKTIETRTHNRFASLQYKTILIHAGQTTDASAANNPYLDAWQIKHNPDEVINGHILGSAFVWRFEQLEPRHSKSALIECEQTVRYGLFLNKVEVFKEPIPCKGEIGIWYFNLETMQKVKKPTINQSKLF